jgi:acetyl esterase/lipase
MGSKTMGSKRLGARVGALPLGILFGMLFGTACTAALPPRAAATATESAAARIVPDVVYGHKEGMALFYDVLKPEHPNGAAVAYMVSGGWVSRWQPPAQRARAFRGLLERGFTVFAVHHGSAPRFKVPDAVADVRLAIRHIRLNAKAHGIDPDRIGVTGGSAGGHLSLMLGTAADAGEAASEDPVLRASDRVQAVVALYPPIDLRRSTGPNRRFPALEFPVEQAEAISPIVFVSADDPPTLLIHGDADELVPLTTSTTILDAFRAAHVESELIVIEGGDHGFRNPEHRARSNAAMIAWFEKHLAPGQAAKAAALAKQQDAGTQQAASPAKP